MKTLTTKTMIAQTLAVGLVLIAAGLLSVALTARSEESRLAQKAERTTRRLKVSLAAPLAQENRDIADAVLAAELMDPEVVGAAIVRDFVPWVSAGIDETQADESILVLDARIGDGGTVRVFFSRTRVGMSIRRETIAAVAELIAVLAVLQFLNLLLFRRIVSRPIHSVLHRLEQIAQGDGDLRMTLDHRSDDEIGRLVVAFNTFVCQLRDIVEKSRMATADIDTATKRLVEEGTNQAQAAAAMLRASGSIDGHMTEVLAGTETSLESGTDITSRLTVFEQYVQQQTIAAEGSSAAVEQMLASMNTMVRTLESKRNGARALSESAAGGRDRAQKIRQHMRDVGLLSERVSEMTSVIRNIAEQTNLLSMNAAIEAAHAGEAGHGFAVVAEEVRKLADTSAEQSVSISEAVTGITEAIRRAGEEAGTNSAIFDGMVEEVGAVVHAFEDVTQNLQELSAGGVQIQTAMQELRTSASTLEENGRGIRVSADAIVGALEHESELVQKTKQQSAAITIDADQVDTLTRVMGLLINQVHGSVGNLQQTFQRFSTEGTGGGADETLCASPGAPDHPPDDPSSPQTGRLALE